MAHILPPFMMKGIERLQELPVPDVRKLNGPKEKRIFDDKQRHFGYSMKEEANLGSNVIQFGASCIENPPSRIHRATSFCERADLAPAPKADFPHRGEIAEGQRGEGRSAHRAMGDP